MITEPEMTDEPGASEAAGTSDGPPGPASRDEVADAGSGRHPGRPWPWVVGTAAATCAVGALVLHAVGYGDPHAPDLHGYHLSSPCAGDGLKPLTEGFGADDARARPAEEERGPAVDAMQCTLGTSGHVETQWQALYDVTATVVLHKKTDPTAEFEDLAGVHPRVVDPLAAAGTAETTRSSPVPGLGDEAFLLTRDSELILTVRHGGAVFTLDLSAQQVPVDLANPPTDHNGYPARPPSLSRFEPAMEQSLTRIMAALAR